MISISCLESKLLNNNNWYGRFQLAPFQKGEGLTVANALRRTLLAEKSNFFITWVDFYNAEIPYSVLTGMRESIFDILLNLKQVIFTSDKIIPNRNTFFKSVSKKDFKSQKVKFLSKKRLKAESEINFLDPSFASNLTLISEKYSSPYDSQGSIASKKPQVEPHPGLFLETRMGKESDELKRQILWPDKGMEYDLRQHNLNIGPNNINNQTIEINQNFKNQKIRSKNVFCKNQIFGKMINSNHNLSSLLKLGIFNKNNNIGDQFSDSENLKKNSNSTYIGYICAKGPTVIYAKDIKLPKGLKCVDPDKYIVTLADDGLFYLRFALTTKIKTLPSVNAFNLSISINNGIKFNKVRLKSFPKILFNKELPSCSSFKIISSILSKKKTLKKSNQQYFNNNQIHFPSIYNSSYSIASYILRRAYTVKNEIKIPWLSQIKLYNSKIDSVNYTKNLINEQRLLLTNDSIKQFNFQNTSIVANIQKTCLLNIQVKHYYYKCGRFDRFLFDLIKPFKPTLKSTYYNFFSRKENFFYQSNGLKVLGSNPLPCTSLFTKFSSSPSLYFPMVSHILSDQIVGRLNPTCYFSLNHFNKTFESPNLTPLESNRLKNKYLLKWQKTFKFSKTNSIYDYFKKLTLSQAALICLLSTRPRVKNKISLLRFGSKRISISGYKNVLNKSAFKFFSFYKNLKQFFSFVALQSKTLKPLAPYIQKPSPFITPSLDQVPPMVSHFRKEWGKYQKWNDRRSLARSNYGLTVNNLRQWPVSALNTSISISGYILSYSLFSKKSSTRVFNDKNRAAAEFFIKKPGCLINQPWIDLNRYKSFNSVQLPKTLRTRPTTSIRQVSYKPMWIFSCNFQQNTNLKRSWLNNLNSNSFGCAQTIQNQFLNASCLVKKSMKKTFNSVPTNSVILKPTYLNVEQIIYILKQTTKFRKNQRINPRFFNSLRKLNHDKFYPTDYYLKFSRLSNSLYNSLFKSGNSKTIKTKQPSDLYNKFITYNPKITRNRKDYKTQMLKINSICRPSVSHIWVFNSNFLFKSNLLDTSLNSQAKTRYRINPNNYSSIGVSINYVGDKPIQVSFVVPSLTKKYGKAVAYKAVACKFQNNSLYNSISFYIPLKVISPNGIRFFKPLRYYQHALNQVIPFSLTNFPYFPQIAITNSLNLNNLDNEPSRPLPYNINIYNSKISFNLRYTYPFKYTIFETFLPFESITSSSAKMAQMFISNEQKNKRFQTPVFSSVGPEAIKTGNQLHNGKKHSHGLYYLTGTKGANRKYKGVTPREKMKLFDSGSAYHLLRTTRGFSRPIASLYSVVSRQVEKPSDEVMGKEMVEVMSYRHFDSIHYNESFKIYTTLAYTCFKTYEPHLSKYHNFNKQNQKKLQDGHFQITNFQKSYLRYGELFNFNMFLEPLIFNWPFFQKNEPSLQYFSRCATLQNKYLLDKISKVFYLKPISVLKFESVSIKQIIIYKIIFKIIYAYFIKRESGRTAAFYSNNFGLLHDPLKNNLLPSIFDSTYKWRILNNPNFNDAFIIIPCTWSLHFQSNGLNLIKPFNLTNWFEFQPNNSQCSFVSKQAQANLDSFLSSLKNSFFMDYAFPTVRQWFETKITFLDFFGKSEEIIKNKLYWSGYDYGLTPPTKYDSFKNKKKEKKQATTSNPDLIGEKAITRGASNQYNNDTYNLSSTYDSPNLSHPDKAIERQMLGESSSVVLKSKQLHLRNLNKNVLKRSLKKLAINFEDSYYKNFLWNSRKITLRILNNAVLPLVTNRKFNISHFIPKKNYGVTTFINNTSLKNISFNPYCSKPFVDSGQALSLVSPLDPRLLRSIKWNYRQSINQQRTVKPKDLGKQFWPKTSNNQIPRFYAIRHKTLKTTNFMCEKTYPCYINGRKSDVTSSLTPIGNPTLKRQTERFDDSLTLSHSIASQRMKRQVEPESDFSFLNSKKRPFFYGSLGYFQASPAVSQFVKQGETNQEKDKLSFVEFLTRKKPQSENNEKYLLPYNQIIPEKLAELRKYQWNKNLTQGSKLSNEFNIDSKTDSKTKPLLTNNFWRSSFFCRYSLYAISTKSDLFLQNLINFSGLKTQNNDDYGSFQLTSVEKNTNTYDGWTPNNNETKENLNEPVFFKEIQPQFKQNDFYQFLKIKPSIKFYEKTIQKILKFQDNSLINDFPNDYYKWQKAIHIAILNRLKDVAARPVFSFTTKRSSLPIAPSNLKHEAKPYKVESEFNKKKNIDEATQNSPIVVEKNHVQEEPVVSHWISVATKSKKYLKRWGGIEKLKSYESDFGNPLRRGIRKELLSIYNVKSLIKLDQKFTTSKSFLKIANQQVLKSWKSTICIAEINIYFCFYYPAFIKNCNLPWKKSKLIFDIPRYWLNKRIRYLKPSSKLISLKSCPAGFFSKTQWPVTKNLNNISLGKINNNLFRFYTQLSSSSSRTHQDSLHNQSKLVISLQDKQSSDVQQLKNLISSLNIHIQNHDSEQIGSYGTVGYFTIKEGLNSIYKVNYIVESHVSESNLPYGFTLNTRGFSPPTTSQYSPIISHPVGSRGVKGQVKPYKAMEGNSEPINRLEFHFKQKNELTNHSFIDFGDNLERLHDLKRFENIQRDSAITDSLTVSNFLNDNYSFAPSKTIMLSSFNELINPSINRSQIQDENEYIQIDIWTNGELSPRQALLNAFKKLFELFYNLSKYNCLKPIEI